MVRSYLALFRVVLAFFVPGSWQAELYATFYPRDTALGTEDVGVSGRVGLGRLLFFVFFVCSSFFLLLCFCDGPFSPGRDADAHEAILLLFRALQSLPTPRLPMSLEARVAKLEDGLSDWSATTRTRWEGMKASDERMQALVKTKTGLWQVKDELFNLVIIDLDPLLSHVPDPNQQMQLRAELREVLSAREDIVGVFPVGGEWGRRTGLDLRYKPSLASFRLCQAVRNVLGPLLRRLDGATVKVWVPLSAGEMAKKRKRETMGEMTTAVDPRRGTVVSIVGIVMVAGGNRLFFHHRVSPPLFFPF